MKVTYHQVRNDFNFRTVKQYCELYVAMDVLQLCDAMEFNRETYRGTHKLDSFASYGTSNYTWKAFQYHNRDSKYKPELFKEGEMNMYCFVKQGFVVAWQE